MILFYSSSFESFPKGNSKRFDEHDDLSSSTFCFTRLFVVLQITQIIQILQLLQLQR